MSFLSIRCGFLDEPSTPLEMLSELGIGYVEAHLRDEPDVESMRQLLEDAGLKLGSLHLPFALDNPEQPTITRQYCEVATELGAAHLFTSVPAAEVTPEAAWQMLRRCGDEAARFDVKIGMETHRPYCHNGDVALQTMRVVNHPAIGLNFDTANIYYYNRDTDSVTELKKIVDHVVSVHLKDTFGEYEQGNFPQFGRGVVDFHGVLQELARAGFDGPLTMELEGQLLREVGPEGRRGFIAECVEHLKALGLS